MKRTFLLMVLVFSAIVTTAPVLADGDFYVIAGGGGVGTKITNLPYIISKSGFYYLGGDLTSTGAGIGVTVDNVTIDLMGFSLNGEGGLVTEGIGMYGRKNVEVRNGTVRSFYIGIQENLEGGANHRIINVRCLNNIQTGISLSGKNHLIKSCTLSDNGTFGIHLGGAGSVIGNTVYTSSGTGINLSTSTDNPITMNQNTVSGTGIHYSGGSTATIWGMNAGSPPHMNYPSPY